MAYRNIPFQLTNRNGFQNSIQNIGRDPNQTLPTLQGYAQQGMGNVNQTMPYSRNTAQARYKKDKAYMPTSKRYGPTRYWKDKIDIVIP